MASVYERGQRCSKRAVACRMAQHRVRDRARVAKGRDASAAHRHRRELHRQRTRHPVQRVVHVRIEQPQLGIWRRLANTALKAPRVGKNIPTVAELTQGEVIDFAARAVEEMRTGGFNVIMEGRAQTLNHVRSPYRFELVMADTSLIGKRRLAQRLGADNAHRATNATAKPKITLTIQGIGTCEL